MTQHSPTTVTEQGPADQATGEPGPADLAAFVSDLEERAWELELRLRERVEESQVLDIEVRSLQTDLRIRDEFVAVLERRLDGQEALERRVAEATAEADRLRGELAARTAEIERYRSRRVVRHVDQLSSAARRRPVVWRALRAARRALH